MLRYDFFRHVVLSLFYDFFSIYYTMNFFITFLINYTVTFSSTYYAMTFLLKEPSNIPLLLCKIVVGKCKCVNYKTYQFHFTISQAQDLTIITLVFSINCRCFSLLFQLQPAVVSDCESK